MRTNKLLVFVALALLVLNGVLGYFLWKERKRPDGHSGNRSNRGNWFAEQLKLDSNQKQQHKQLRDVHFESMKPLFDSITIQKTRLFNVMKEPAGDDSMVNEYSRRIADLEMEITLKNYNHFKQVRALLSADQQTKYDEMMQRMISRKSPPDKPGDRKKEGQK
jgi:Spy/CpxP family protein refolding chaperone